MFNNNIYMNNIFMTKKYEFNNKKLDKFQSKAVYCNKKNYLVVAGAGSGKTLTIAAKVKYLIDNKTTKDKILCLSFTNETVNSLKSILGDSIDVDVKTFHKFAFSTLKGKYSIAADTLLEYINEEYFYSYIYLDNTYKFLSFIDNIDYLKKTIVSFINSFKSLNYDRDFILDLIKNDNIPTDDRIVLTIIFKIYVIYEEELRSQNKLDFNDIINYAVESIDRFKYEYLIIDEYQDISENRYRLIKKISDMFNVSIIAVGDDYQTIYSFAGSNVSLFTNFKKYFSNSKIIKLKNIYRNSYDIVEISKRFVMKNKNQIYKNLKSNIYVKDSINIVYGDLNILIKSLDNILILGRNNKDLEAYKNMNIDNKNIRFLTVHSAKGIESDNVIIVNVIDDKLGFPNKIINNRVLNYLGVNSEIEEERRLFYVALTRCKKQVFISTKKNKESIFIKELLKDFKYKIKIIDLDKSSFNNC